MRQYAKYQIHEKLAHFHEYAAICSAPIAFFKLCLLYGYNKCNWIRWCYLMQAGQWYRICNSLRLRKLAGFVKFPSEQMLLIRVRTKWNVHGMYVKRIISWLRSSFLVRFSAGVNSAFMKRENVTFTMHFPWIREMGIPIVPPKYGGLFGYWIAWLKWYVKLRIISTKVQIKIMIAGDFTK